MTGDKQGPAVTSPYSHKGDMCNIITFYINLPGYNHSMFKLSAFRTGTAALALTALYALPAQATQVATSIKPLELLVRAVADDSVQVTTLVPPGASPHTYTMRPSQRRALQDADLIFWVGPEMESFLIRLLAGEEFHDRAVALAGDEDHHEEESDHDHHDEAGSEHDHHEEAEHEHDDEHPDEHEHEVAGHEGHHHDHGDGEDPHIWVDPETALDMAREIHHHLSELKGANQEQLDQNLKQFEVSLKATEQQIRTTLEPARKISLFAYHSAFERFAEHYDLTLEGVLTLNPELTPGARHIAEVQETLRNANHPCLLTEPQFNRQWWQSITRDMDVTFSTWDPLATDIKAGPEGYIEFQTSIADAVLQCLPEQP